MLYRVEIHTAEEELLVTVIEILSPANKHPGHETTLEYRRQRRDLFRSAAHLLEIDLLRAGERPPLEEAVPDAPYYVMLSRAERRPRVEGWPIPDERAAADGPCAAVGARPGRAAGSGGSGRLRLRARRLRTQDRLPPTSPRAAALGG